MLKDISKLCAVVFLAALWIQPAMAVNNVNIEVTPATSSGGVNFDVVGSNAVYEYTVYDGQAVNDTIPATICMTGSESGWTSIGVSFGIQAGTLPGVTAPANQTFLATTTTPDCRNVSILIGTGPLDLIDPDVAQNFNANFSLASVAPNPAIGSNKPNINFAGIKNLHIKVTVLPEIGSNLSCFLTDSESNFLADCSGTPVTVSGSDKGRFVIVTNKRNIEVATNPGQFYYNLIWHNTTGSTQTVDADFEREGVDPKGRQAIHAAVFNGLLDPLTATEFNQANVNGIPEGIDDAVHGVEVPAGSSLLVTYHLEWNGLGQSVPADCAQSCEQANQHMSVTGIVSGSGIPTEECEAEAYGHKK